MINEVLAEEEEEEEEWRNNMRNSFWCDASDSYCLHTIMQFHFPVKTVALLYHDLFTDLFGRTAGN